MADKEDNKNGQHPVRFMRELLRDLLQGASEGMANANGLVGPITASKLGTPGMSGVSKNALNAILNQPEKEADVEEKQARAEFFRRSLGRGVQQTLNEKNQRLKQLENLVLGRQGIIIKTTSPDAFNVLDSEYQNLRNELGRPTTPTQTTSQFTAPEQVRDAFREGRLTREQARKEIERFNIKR